MATVSSRTTLTTGTAISKYRKKSMSQLSLSISGRNIRHEKTAAYNGIDQLNWSFDSGDWFRLRSAIKTDAVIAATIAVVRTARLITSTIYAIYEGKFQTSRLTDVISDCAQNPANE
jgi:hypothetical protein